MLINEKGERRWKQKQRMKNQEIKRQNETETEMLPGEEGLSKSQERRDKDWNERPRRNRNVVTWRGTWQVARTWHRSKGEARTRVATRTRTRWLPTITTSSTLPPLPRWNTSSLPLVLSPSSSLVFRGTRVSLPLPLLHTLTDSTSMKKVFQLLLLLN